MKIKMFLVTSKGSIPFQWIKIPGHYHTIPNDNRLKNETKKPTVTVKQRKFRDFNTITF